MSCIMFQKIKELLIYIDTHTFNFYITPATFFKDITFSLAIKPFGTETSQTYFNTVC